MNSFITLVTGILIFLANSSDIPYSTIEKAIKANDSKTIIQLGKDPIQLNILGKEGAYKHSQAEMILGDFFTKIPKGEFVFVFKGKETEDGVYSFGYYQANSGKFKVSLHFHKVKNEMKFETLTISKEKK